MSAVSVRHSALSVEPAPIAGARWVALTRGMFALVDEGDFARVSGRGWCAHRQERNGVVYWYAVASAKREKPYMHRFILGAQSGELVDHRNGDSLDNRRANLRIATRAQNARNRKTTEGRRFKGITVCRTTGKYVAQLMVDGAHLQLGRFVDAIDAARAYDRGARKHFGDFARLNFPEEM